MTTTEVDLIKIKVIKRKHADQLNHVPVNSYKPDAYEHLANCTNMCWVLTRRKVDGYLFKVDHAVLEETMAGLHQCSYRDAHDKVVAVLQTLPQLFLD